MLNEQSLNNRINEKEIAEANFNLTGFFKVLVEIDQELKKGGNESVKIDDQK